MSTLKEKYLAADKTDTTTGMEEWANATIESLRQQLATANRLLAESQAREPVAWRKRFNGKWEIVNAHVFLNEDAIATGWEPLYTAPSDSTALDAAITKAKREENEACAKVCENLSDDPFPVSQFDCAEAIRQKQLRADELKGGEQ